MIEEFSHVTSDYALYSTEDMMTMEHDVQELLAGFIRATKPDVVVEIGTWKGFTSVVIGAALARNRKGHLYAIEIDPFLAEETRNRTAHLPVDVTQADANVVKCTKSIDLLLVDGQPDRAKEFNHWWEQVNVGGFVFIHDALKGADTARWVLDLHEAMIILKTPRGLAIVQKKEDLSRFA